MPHVINGIGTWYYGKRRIHSIKGACEFCGHEADLTSYDTTLFFVVIFIPVIPLSKKRILGQCSVCQKHRVISLAKWEEAKERDSADLLEKLRRNPRDRDAILHAIDYALAYQDGPLFNNVVESLAVEHTGDAALQARLGDAYAYFAQADRAEQAYRASLAIEDKEVIREQLAWALIRQGRPDEARPYLQHVIDQKKRDAAGMIYFLVAGYQAQGRHEEALAIMDERDEAFPDWATTKEYQRQRTISTRHQGTGKPVRSAILSAGKAGYREGNWTARVPRWLAASVLLGALGLYLGSALWIGQARKVYFVNGTSQPYGIVVQGAEHTLRPNSATPIRIGEGDLQVAFSDAKLALEPVQGSIETSFWTRPFAGYTFVINPDQSAILLEEEAYYAKANPPPGPPPIVHFGQAYYSLPGVDFEFQGFPATQQVSEHSAPVKRTRIALASGFAPEVRLGRVLGLPQPEQIPFCKRLLRLDPSNTLMLYLLVGWLAPEEFIAFVESRLEERPILVEWHRLYQTQMELAHPETDLRPRYRKLLADSNGAMDALYLLGRADPDPDAGDKLFRQAASAVPPSGYAIYALGYRAMCEARFAEAGPLLAQALPLLNEKSMAQQLYQEVLLANRDYDTLLQALQGEARTPGRKLSATTQMARVYAIRGDKAKAQEKVAEAAQIYAMPAQGPASKVFEAMLSCCTGDLDGYLKAMDSSPSFESAILRGQLKQAASLASESGLDSSAMRGLLYLEATRAGDKELAQSQWDALLAELNRHGREQKLMGAILAGRKRDGARPAQRLLIEPIHNRVLLAVVAQRYPDQAGELLPLAQRLDFQHDAVSLCLRKFLQKP